MNREIMEAVKEMEDVKKVERRFKTIPVGMTVYRSWQRIPSDVWESIYEKFAAHGGDPWVFAGDARTFWQFADRRDVDTMYSLSQEEHDMLLSWSESDWDPTSFGYWHPRPADD